MSGSSSKIKGITFNVFSESQLRYSSLDLPLEWRLLGLWCLLSSGSSESRNFLGKIIPRALCFTDWGVGLVA